MKINITVGDIETTGLDQEKGDRIIEIAFLMYAFDTETGKIEGLGKYTQRVYPDKAISAKAQSIHNISIDDLIGSPLWEDVAGQVAKHLTDTDLFVAHNSDFDAPFLSNELLRVGIAIPDIEIFCTMKEGRFATYDGAVPSLRVLCGCFGIKYDLSEAHAALYDTAQTAKCFFLGLKQGYFKLPEIFTTIEEVA